MHAVILLFRLMWLWVLYLYDLLHVLHTIFVLYEYIIYLLITFMNVVEEEKNV